MATLEQTPSDIVNYILEKASPRKYIHILSLAFTGVKSLSHAPRIILWAGLPEQGHLPILTWYCNMGCSPKGIMEQALRGGNVKIARWLKMKYKDDLRCTPDLLSHVIRRKDVPTLEFLLRRQNVEFGLTRKEVGPLAKEVLRKKKNDSPKEVMNVLPSAVEIACEEGCVEVLGWASTMSCLPSGTN